MQISLLAYSFFFNNFLNNHRIWKIKPVLKSGLTFINVKYNLLLKMKIHIFFNEMHNYANEVKNFGEIPFSDSGFFSGSQRCFPFVNPWSGCQVMTPLCMKCTFLQFASQITFTYLIKALPHLAAFNKKMPIGLVTQVC